MSTRSPLLCCPLCALAAGCGNLSNEDLVFLAAIPRAEEVALDVAAADAGGTPGALTADAVGDPAEMYAAAAEIADGFNAGTGDLLDWVDSLGRGAPPTERTESARIWGPVHDLDHSGLSLRLEIRREAHGDGARFVFCLQLARQSELGDREPTCTDLEGTGYASVLSGHFDPAPASQSARSGAGLIRLDFEALERLGAGDGESRGTLELSYDFSGGGLAKQIHIEWVGPLTVDTMPERLTYDYGRDADGVVDMSFSVANHREPGNPGENPADWEVDATWSLTGPGRADAIGRGGDLPEGHAVWLVECWDAARARTYLRMTLVVGGESQTPPLVVEGDPLSCPAS